MYIYTVIKKIDIIKLKKQIMKTLKINKQKGQFYYNFKGNEFIINWGRKENQFEQVDKFTETDLRSAND